LMLVDYSDSEHEDDEAPSAAPVPAAPKPAAQLAAAFAPPAKRARVEVNLQSLLQKNDTALPFEEASKLPADFFDSARVREPDAGEADAPATRGWAALSSMLPAPKNQPKSGPSKLDPGALFRNAKPLKRGSAVGAGSGSAYADVAPFSSAAPMTSLPPAADPAGPAVEWPPAKEAEAVAADEDSAAGAASSSVHAPPPPAASLLPRVRVGMYDAPAAEESADASSAPLPYEVPVGPAMGPESAVAEAAYGDVTAAYGEHIDEERIVDVSMDAMRKAMGQAKQYDFAVPANNEEVKIASKTWSRSSGTVEQSYKASSLQKRKHQINSLAADAAQRSAEVYARGTKGMKSKKETAAKYGW